MSSGIGTISIRHRYTGAVLYEYAPPDAAHASLRCAVEAAVAANTHLIGASLRYADLRGASLRGASLPGADLSEADLRRADLGEADLRRANLRRANLRRANLRRANMRCADLSEADLRWADLSDAYLSGAYLRGADLRGAVWADEVIVSREPMCVTGLHWDVWILDAHMQIGCELHSLAEWASFDDKRIVQMGGRDALRFWREHKAGLLAMAGWAMRE
jgi:hypothetical protein